MEEKEYYPLSSAQKRLYILYQLDPNTVNYNVSNIVVLEGKRIKEMGSHKELISLDGLYKQLYTVQQRIDLELESLV